MRKSPLLIFMALGALALGACHTTEANYRAAYDVAKARATEENPERMIDPEVQAKLDRAEKRRHTIYIVGNDTLDVTTRFFVREDSAGAPIPEFMVAVHGFEQRFNALAMMKRLRANGFPEAFVARTSNPTYYVIAGASDSIASVPALIRKAKEETSALGLAPGYPVVLRNPDRKK